MAIITLTTDFGTDSPYVAEMKGVLLTRAPTATIVDLTHAIAPHNVLAAARAVARSSRYFPPGSIHVVVVDPGVGTERALVCVESDGHFYLAPDNGVLGGLAKRGVTLAAVQLAEPRFWREAVSNTFHGRDILAPVAAYLAQGGPSAALGPPLPKLQELAWPPLVRSPAGLTGALLAIDAFGNCVTNITRADLPFPAGGALHFRCGRYASSAVVRTYGERPPGTPVALLGSGDEWELAVVQGNAARAFDLQVGDEVRVSWNPAAR